MDLKSLTYLHRIELNVYIRTNHPDCMDEYFSKPIVERGSLITFVKNYRPDIYPEVLAIAAQIRLKGE